jgi:hypothetical protein
MVVRVALEKVGRTLRLRTCIDRGLYAGHKTVVQLLLECLRAWWNNGLIKRAYTTSVFHQQIYPFLLHHRQFPHPEGI